MGTHCVQHVKQGYTIDVRCRQELGDLRCLALEKVAENVCCSLPNFLISLSPSNKMFLAYFPPFFYIFDMNDCAWNQCGHYHKPTWRTIHQLHRSELTDQKCFQQRLRHYHVSHRAYRKDRRRPS